MLTFLALTATLAMAEEPACPSTAEAIREGLQEALGLYDQFEFDAFQERFDRLVAEIECSSGPLSRADAFQVYQVQSLDALVAEDREGMVAALRAMIAVRPEYTLPEALAAPGSTMAEAYAAAKQAEVAEDTPLSGEPAWYVDGVMGVSALPTARAVLVQHLVEGQTPESWLLDGATRPESLTRYLQEGGGNAQVLAIPPTDASRGGGKRHPSRTLAMGGAASVAVAVAGFAVAGSAYQRFPDEPDRAKAESLEGLNHMATIGGGVFAVAGGGLLAVAMIKGEW